MFDSPLLALAFRPFFLAGAFYAAFAILWWAAYLLGWVALPAYFEPRAWHAHEMLFGFVSAILGGFLLTASRNWAKTRGVHGKSLFYLFAVWVAGRLGILLSDHLPKSLVAALDLLYLAWLAVLLLQTLSKGGKKTNFAFVFWLGVLFSANLLMHLEALGIARNTARTGYLLAVDTMVVIMTIMGGRIIPMFTQNAVPGIHVRSLKSVDYIAVGGSVLYLLSDLVSETAPVTALVAVLAGTASLVRLSGWRSPSTFRYPILWVLHVGYLFIGVGLVARGACLSIFPTVPSTPLHLLTAGAMGSLILGMISRVALGHTGRPIIAPVSIVLAYALVIVGAFARVFIPTHIPLLYAQAMAASALLWALGFLIYGVRYWPILTRPRMDGLEG